MGPRLHYTSKIDTSPRGNLALIFRDLGVSLASYFYDLRGNLALTFY